MPKAIHGIYVQVYSGPEVVDWDKDGVNDLIVGSAFGTLHFFKGSLDGTIMRDSPEQNLFHGIDVGARGKYNSPEVLAWDKIGNNLIVGNNDGTLHFFKGSRNGTIIRASLFHGIIDVGYRPSSGLQRPHCRQRRWHSPLLPGFTRWQAREGRAGTNSVSWH